MTTVYLSHSREDSTLAKDLATALTKSGFSVNKSAGAVSAGENWRKSLDNALKNADIVVALITENSVASSRVKREFFASRLHVERHLDQAALIPVVVGDCAIPEALGDIEGIYRSTAEEVVDATLSSVEIESERIEQWKLKRQKSSEQLRENAPRYINETIEDLRNRERRDRVGALICYILGFGALFGGLLYTVAISKEMFSVTIDAEKLWVTWALYTTKSAIVIGLSVALSKYSFNLGKSFMNEGLKNSDRRHAISFGRFYIETYGESATYEEVKDAFQHWNMARDSSFLSLDGKDFDPNFMAHVIEVAKVLRTQEVQGKELKNDARKA
jgi:hypothetical protein